MQRNVAGQTLIAPGPSLNSSTTDGADESTLMRLNKSMAKVIIKLGARVTTLEAKVGVKYRAGKAS
eukprot:m.8098 g.8098  ORF g.8098 m.8098 type:complete len:66 (+) comp9035_c0_seq2:1035-1232(+)